MFFVRKILSIVAFVLFFIVLWSCSTVKETTSLMTGKEIYADETYQQIQKNENRLHAMLAGKFVQYNKASGDYKTWMVNGGNDSVVIYFIPVGNPAKDGLWLYHYQLMTSLPNEPIYEAFSKLEVIDRDTTRGVYYEAPDDFNVPIETLLENPKTAFETIDFDKLERSRVGEEVLYFREKALYFTGESQFIRKDANGKEYGHFLKDHYEVSPSGMTYNTYYYNADKTAYKASDPDKLVKMAAIRGVENKGR